MTCKRSILALMTVDQQISLIQLLHLTGTWIGRKCPLAKKSKRQYLLAVAFIMTGWAFWTVVAHVQPNFELPSTMHAYSLLYGYKLELLARLFKPDMCCRGDVVVKVTL